MDTEGTDGSNQTLALDDAKTSRSEPTHSAGVQVDPSSASSSRRPTSPASAGARGGAGTAGSSNPRAHRKKSEVQAAVEETPAKRPASLAQWVTRANILYLAGILALVYVYDVHIGIGATGGVLAGALTGFFIGRQLSVRKRHG